MAVFRRRLIFWLFRAYVKRWGKVIAACFFLGLLIFFGLVYSSRYISRLIPAEKKTKVGVIGAYNVDNLPGFVVNEVSHGLTKISPDGSVHPDVAEKWIVSDNGKTYTFILRKDLRFSDGTKVTSKDINYNFANVTVDRNDPSKIVFHLKDAYSPFLVTTSRPIFKKGYVGIGDHKLSGIRINGNFVDSLSVSSVKDRFFNQSFLFYPSEEALKHAFALGEITQARGLSNDAYRSSSFSAFQNANVERKVDYTRLVTLFFNTQDPVLSDKKVRNALSYAIPDTFGEGERALVPYPPHSIYLNHEVLDRKEDIDHATLLIDAAKVSTGGDTKDKDSTGSAFPVFVIKTTPKYRHVAEQVIEHWKKIGVEAKIEEEETVPTSFQIYLGDFMLPKDPDQYVLWHSISPSNITKLRSQRLDKLLEDGRKITDVEERKKIYNDFQKYILDETPAAFLYFPNDYVITRK